MRSSTAVVLFLLCLGCFSYEAFQFFRFRSIYVHMQQHQMAACKVIVIPPDDAVVLWKSRFGVLPVGRIVKRTSFDDMRYSEALSLIRFRSGVDGLMDLYKWRMPEYSLFNFYADVANAKICGVQAMVCFSADSIEYCRFSDGYVSARELWQGRQIRVWTTEQGGSYEYAQFHP